MYRSLYALSLLLSGQIYAADLSQYQLVFDSNRSGYQEIHVMDADGKNEFQVTHRRQGMPDHDARWIPGKDKVGFQSYRKGGWRIWTIDISGQSPKLFTDYGNYEGEPNWSTINKEVVFTSYRPTMNIFVADSRGHVLRQLTHFKNYSKIADHPRWSADGKYITFISNIDGDYEVFIMDSDGNHTKQLTFNSSADFSPSLSSDGENLLYLSEQHGQFESYLLNIKTGKHTKISSNPKNSENDYRSELMEGTSSFRSLAPTWSPDGQWIAYYCYEQKNAEICIADKKGKFVKRITHNNFHDGAPSWRFKPK